MAAQNPEYELYDVSRHPDNKEVLRVRIRVYNYLVVFYREGKKNSLRWYTNPLGKQVAYFPGQDICDTALFKQARKQAAGIFASSRQVSKKKKERAPKQLTFSF
ncbi:MAG: hypothetical protein UU54_C0001G0021 [Candidatus Yanofskybacteria bacterium GW2011_GWA2_41_22]|uniref:Uncharacterized protein n=5 Tax=Parcubacteria group TaxID=1794811 RepID=A0A1F8HV42_9BACT|nr:MAG: hypothetical protein UU54_C0001G0021 [Candidatus Yanofskybacteria bacterium GW2011_GWA2_41_22]KKS24682.1 MAG: hypothetical protein UU83_C0021G0006 [Candidatus Jorgensenbacteria bacterium GW2011_GWF2_41_8]KKS27395.1 MAG: hypothetical protein UU84_C0005G0003 [Candidatus Yanofskybacteria bacterium GW2011_GWC2_41_9]OGM99927.1 MAG: hypothetical protein A2736_03105 [Candidatus Yanofskybacteria bacterium RIFCSPHIGHO2_01_FULL_41_27]OGN10170.1 MAG: hypothetical protein A3C64_02565 [Candidatus Ya